MTPLRATILGVIGLWAFALMMCYGCDQGVKDKAALLACTEYGGVKHINPKIDRLEVQCKDGTVVSVKYLP